LAWLVIKDFFEFQGETSITGSRDAFRIAFKRSLISDGELWMTMIESRKKSVHTYNEEMAEVLQKEILHNYMPLFRHLEKNLTEHSEGKQNKLF
jgi:nucleotidyltransferase substrate binding protein (TIGR01987 family)